MKLIPEEEALIETIRRSGPQASEEIAAYHAVTAAERVLEKAIAHRRALKRSASIAVREATDLLEGIYSGEYYCIDHDEFGHGFNGCPTCGAGRNAEKAGVASA